MSQQSCVVLSLAFFCATYASLKLNLATHITTVHILTCDLILNASPSWRQLVYSSELCIGEVDRCLFLDRSYLMFFLQLGEENSKQLKIMSNAADCFILSCKTSKHLDPVSRLSVTLLILSTIKCNTYFNNYQPHEKTSIR